MKVANFQNCDIENSKEPVKTIIQKRAKEWILSSTSHGLPSVFRTDQLYLKIMWMIFFLGGTAGCIYIVVSYVRDFFDYETNVTVEIVTEMPAYFPAITLCNLNPFFKPRADTYIRGILSSNNLTYLLNLTKINNDTTALSISNNALNILKTAVATNQTMSADERESLGLKLSDMLISCTFNGETCTSSSFSYLESYDHLNCYTFNSGYDSNGNAQEIKQINNAGSANSLEIELFVGDQTKDEYFVYKSGAYVLVHNQSITPLLASEGVEIATGFQNNLAIKRTFITNLPSPYSSCLEDTTSSTAYNSDLYKAIFYILGHKQYRQKYCYKLCYQQQVIKTCKCFDPSLANPFPVRNGDPIGPCTNSTETVCQGSVKSEFQSSDVSIQCNGDCPVECSFIYYDVTPSISLYPTTFYSNWLSLQSDVTSKFDKGSASTFSTGMLKLNVFYAAMDYTSIEQSPALTWDVLLGNIGGMLGLFVGISILSVLEVFELMFEIIRILWTHNHGVQKPVPTF